MSNEKLLINNPKSNNSEVLGNIEEMAKILESFCDLQDDSQDEGLCIADCDICRAKALYNAGYRKQSEGIANNATTTGEWKKLYDKAPRYVCTACNHLYNNKEYKYCPNCGAKMKGGAE